MFLKPVINRFTQNHKGFYKVFWPMVLLFSLGMMADAASTIYFILKDGSVDREVNVSIRIACDILGPVGGPIFGAICKIVAGLLVAIYLRRIAFYLFLIGIIISFWAAWYNIWGADIYIPRILHWLCP